MRFEARQYIRKKYPDRYGRFMDCSSCSEGGLRVSDEEKLVFQHIADEDKDYVYLECPDCGRGGKYQKPIGDRGLRFVVTG